MNTSERECHTPVALCMTEKVPREIKMKALLGTSRNEKLIKVVSFRAKTKDRFKRICYVIVLLSKRRVQYLGQRRVHNSYASWKHAPFLSVKCMTHLGSVNSKRENALISTDIVWN